MKDYVDDELAAAAPPVAERTPAMRSALLELVDDTERAATPRRRRGVRTATAAIAVAAFAGAGTAAAAAGWVPSPWWEEPGATTQQTTSASGQACEVTFAPRAISDEAHPVGPRNRAAAMTAAGEFLRQFDYTTLDDLSTLATQEELEASMNAALAEQGLSVHAVSVALATDCPSGTDR